MGVGHWGRTPRALLVTAELEAPVRHPGGDAQAEAEAEESGAQESTVLQRGLGAPVSQRGFKARRLDEVT